MKGRKQPTTAWHSLDASEVARKLNASESGLSENVAEARLAEYGPNKLPQKPPTPLWAIVLRQFRSPLIYILALAAVVSLAIGDVKDAAFIVGVLVLNGGRHCWRPDPSPWRIGGILFLLALTIFPVMELHKLSWNLRHREHA